ncbi:ATP-binding protein [Actinoallomurus spadix]|uniref:Histidine kinase/HSP90-like ATPase domain-containing protein n=1 Tax=Actinoallomurus spadix TaxID=79912 RepID=A0ABP3HK72_9ACTN|nr:ATP-binding protein [Actinoallomurus spadix]MCO5991152.1 ATP-binding protein [Actinoallomurus spadix]
MDQTIIEMGDTAILRIKGRPERVRAARAFARASLRRFGCDPDAVDDGELIVSELVTNAIRVAPDREIRILIFPIREYVTIQVYDPVDALPHQRHAGVHDESGRGIPIVSRCARRYGAFRVADGKIVWAMVRRHA